MRLSPFAAVILILVGAVARPIAAQSPTATGSAAPASAAPLVAPTVVFQHVRVLDVMKGTLSAPTSVTVAGDRIVRIGAGVAAVPAPGLTVIDGKGRVLMPGLIDAHVHLEFLGVSQVAALTADEGFLQLVAGREAQRMLLRGFTTVRDMGGPTFGLKLAIDQGVIDGPRIYPSGAFISQTGGHGDFRLPYEVPAEIGGPLSHAERAGAAAIADSPDAVRLRAREQLMLGATQLKLMAGGGVSSVYDPLDVTQYTIPEIRAAVEAAENWGTYVAVHAYTPRAIRMAIEAGVKCIEHGQLNDEPTARLMAEKGIWWSLQPFLDDSFANPKQGAARQKQLEMSSGTDKAYGLAKKYRIRTAWGTDMLFNPTKTATQGAQLAKLERWYSPAEILRMATADNAALLALSGPRNPYPAPLGVVAEGAYADLILVDGDPLQSIGLVADPDRNFVVIMKGGRIYKNATP